MSFSNLHIQQMASSSFGADDSGGNIYNWPSENVWSEMNQLPSDETWNNLQQNSIQSQGMLRAGTDPGGGPGGRPPLPLGESLGPLLAIACIYFAYSIYRRFRKRLHSR